jgi:hypothetical protein
MKLTVTNPPCGLTIDSFARTGATRPAIRKDGDLTQNMRVVVTRNYRLQGIQLSAFARA